VKNFFSLDIVLCLFKNVILSKKLTMTVFVCQRISPGLRCFETFCNALLFYDEGLLAPHTTPKLENHPFSAV